MEYAQKAKDFVYNAARVAGLTAAGAGFLLGIGCNSNQPITDTRSPREIVRYNLKQSKADEQRYLALTPEQQKKEPQEQLEIMLKDGKIEAKELPVLAKIIKRAKDQPELLATATKALDSYIKENPVKVFYVFAKRQGEHMEWYFLEPEGRAELKVDNLRAMSQTLGVQLEDLLTRASQKPSFPGQTIPNGSWTQEQFNNFNDFLWAETVQIPESNLKAVSDFMRDDKLTDGMLTVAKKDYDLWADSGRIVNGLLYVIPVEKPKEEPKEAQPAQPAQPAGGQPAQPAQPAEIQPEKAK